MLRLDDVGSSSSHLCSLQFQNRLMGPSGVYVVTVVEYPFFGLGLRLCVFFAAGAGFRLLTAEKL